LFFLSYLPYNIIQPRYETLSLANKVLPCLINNVAMSLGGQVIGMFEGTGKWFCFIHLNFVFFATTGRASDRGRILHI
jgi:hypothetical protein